MDLNHTLFSTPMGELVPTLNEMLSKPTKVTISWWGIRYVSIEGLEGSIEVDELARKFLSSGHTDRTSKGRLDSYELWGKIQKLYHDGTEAAAKSYLIGNLTVVKDIKNLTNIDHPMTRIFGLKGDPREQELFDYTPEEFQKIWPGTNPPKTIGDAERETWIASKEMIEEQVRGDSKDNQT